MEDKNEKQQVIDALLEVGLRALTARMKIVQVLSRLFFAMLVLLAAVLGVIADRLFTMVF